MAEHRYTIELLGASITIRTEEDLMYIKKLVQHVQDTAQEIQSSLALREPLSVAIMTAVFLADENLRLKTRISSEEQLPSQFSMHTQSEPSGDAAKASDVLANIEKMLDRTLKH